MAKSFEGRYIQALSSFIKAFDSAMRFIVDPRFCQSSTEWALLELSFFAIITISPVLFFGWSPWFLVALPVLWGFNIMRHAGRIANQSNEIALSCERSQKKRIDFSTMASYIWTSRQL